MAYGKINLDTLQTLTSLTPPVFKDGNGEEIGKLCRAWVMFNGVAGASPVILGSYNVTSVSRVSAGLYTITYTNPMPTAYYCAVANTQPNTYGGTWAGTGTTQAGTQTTTQGTVEVRVTSTNANGDSNMISYAVFA